ncbi:MAG: outer membrane protein assembly factor BamB family protein [Planctomycetota bacterium]
MAVDPQTGRELWRSGPEEMAPLTLAARGGRVYYHNYRQIVCLDRADGRELWRTPDLQTGTGHRATVGTLVAHEAAVLFAPFPMKGKKGSGRLLAFSPADGKLLWRGPDQRGLGITNPPDLFVASGLVWTGETRLPITHEQIELRRTGLDPLTGEPVREVVVPKLISWGHHYRCYRSKATERFLMLPKRGVEFVDLTGSDHMRHDWLRPPCIFGVMPANGLLYTAPHQCVCYQGVLLSNFNALAAADEGEAQPPVPARRLERGPAWGGKETGVTPSDGDWPTYRRDALRSGAARMAAPGGLRHSLPDSLEEKWRAEFRGRLTPPVAVGGAGGLVLVAETDAHTVHALSADGGKRVWSFTASGRVDSPPTIHGGLVLFGSADGRVYCLRLADGREVWRFLAAPSDRRVGAFGQIESAWPVHGSVLVQRDATADPPRAVAYVTAGRSSFLDEGIRLYGLDPATGEVLHEAGLDGPRPDPFKDRGGAGYMDGSKSDILVSDGADIFLFQERFRSDLKRVPAPMQGMAKERGGFRDYPAFPARGSSAKHLITTGGLFDDTCNEGSYWTYGRRWPGWNRHMSKIPAYGQLLVFDERALYGVHVNVRSIRVRRGRTLGKGERLFARDHDGKKDRWSKFVPIRVRAMVLAGEKLLIAGPPDEVPPDDPLAAVEGRRGARLWTVSAADGSRLAERALDAPPVFDGMIAANGCVYVTTLDGRVTCLGK